MRRRHIFIIGIAVCIGIAIGYVLGFTVGMKKSGERGIIPDQPDGVACTMEAKECPDGSFVGRVSPDCAFAPCPGE